MKGYKLDKTLYIFPQEAGAIPYVAEDVEKICIQQEDLAAWKTANSDYADLMVPYNYNIMSIQKKPWADYVDEDIVEPEPEPKKDPEIAWSADSATVRTDDLQNLPTLINPNNITEIAYTSSNIHVADISPNGHIALVSPGEAILSAIFDGDEEYEASTVTCDLTVEDGGGSSGASGAS